MLGKQRPASRAFHDRAISSSRRPHRATNPLWSAEALEPRLLLATISWATDASGDWSNPANWNLNRLPAAGDDVVISRPGANPTVTVSAGTHSIRSLRSDEKIRLAGGTLDVATTAQVNAILTLDGGTLAHATVSSPNYSRFVTGRLGTGLSFDGGNDHVDMGDPPDNDLDIGGNATLEAWVKFDALPGPGSFATLISKDVGPGNTNKWIFGYAQGYAGIANATVFHINGAGGSDWLQSNPWTPVLGRWYHLAAVKSGNNYTFYRDGVSDGVDSTSAAVADVAAPLVMGRAEGAFHFSGVMDEPRIWTTARTGPAIQAAMNQELTGVEAGLAGCWRFNEGFGTTALDATPNANHGAVSDRATLRGQSGVLDGVTLDADLDLTGNNAAVAVVNGLTLNGTASVGSGAADYSILAFDGTQTLSGTGTVVFGLATRPSLRQTVAGATLTIGPGVTIRGGGLPGFGGGVVGGPSVGSVVNRGRISADVAGALISTAGQSLTNLGTLEAKNGGTLALGGNWINTGTISETDATVNLGGTFSLAALGTFNRTRGAVNVTGTLDNAGTTLALSDATGSWALAPGGTLRGGRVTTSGAARLVARGGLLDGVTVDGDMLVTGGGNPGVVNGLVLNGTARVGEDEDGSHGRASLQFYGTQTLSGGGTVITPGPYGDTGLGFGHPADGVTVTVGAGITIRGNFGNFFGGGSGRLINRGTIQADTPGGLLTVGGLAVTNEGTIRATAGGSLGLSNLKNGAGKTVSVSGGGTLILGGAWTNAGTIVSTNSPVNFGGTFTLTAVGTFQRTGGAVNVTGTLDNTGTTLALSDATGSWTLARGGTIRGGRVTTSGAARLVARDGALDGVTVDGDLDVPGGGDSGVVNGLVLNGTARVGEADGANGRASLRFYGTQTLSGGGTVVIPGPYGDTGLGLGHPADGATLTVGPGITIRGNFGYVSGGSGHLVNRGTILADTPGGLLTVGGLTVANEGTFAAVDGGTLRISAPSPDLMIREAGRLSGRPSGTIETAMNVRGDTRNAALFNPQGTVRLNGAGTAASPQFLEAMSQDRGTAAAGPDANFLYGTLSLANGTHVRLVDQADNVAGAGPEAVYVNSLIVPAGCTLDLNGLRLYARAVQVAGTIVGGAVTLIPDGGPVFLDSPVPGFIAAVGQQDDWTFFSRGGRAVTAVLNPGTTSAPAPGAPQLNWAEVQVLNAAGNVLGSAHNNGSGSGAVVTLSGVSLPSDGTYRVRVHTPAGHSSSTGNYYLTLYDVTPEVGIVSLNEQATGSLDRPYSINRWDFFAAAGQQVRFDLLGASTPNLRFRLSGPNGYTGFTDLAGDSGLVNLPASGTYTLTAYAAADQTGDYSFQLLESSQSDLALGATHNGTLAGSGHAQLFRVNVPATVPVRLTLDGSVAGDRIELYARRGAPPTRGEYDFRSVEAAPDQQLLAPLATAGDWYVLVYTDHVLAPSTYTLSPTAAGLILSGVTPDHHGNAADAVVTITGAGFDGPTTASLVSGANTYPAASTQVDSFTQLTATFAAGSVPPGTYTLHVAQPDGDSADLPDVFRVTAGGQARLETNLVVPGNLGRHAVETIYVEYANRGDVAMDAPLLVLGSGDADGSDRPLLTLDRSRVVEGFWTSAVPAGFSNSVQILASGATPGVLHPGESFRVPVYFAGLLLPYDFSDTAVEFSLGVLTTDNAAAIDYAALKDDMRPPSISAAAWEPLFSNFAVQTGPTWGGFVNMLDDNAAYLGRLGQRVVDVGSLLAFEFQQADGLSPLRTLAQAVDAAMEAPGLPLVFARSFPEPISQRYELGPFGRGWSHSWQTSLARAADGTVTVLSPAGSRRTFQPDSRDDGYFAQPGDHATLTALAGGAFSLREHGGLLRAFRADGKLNYVEDTNGNRITAGYDAAGRLKDLTHSSGQSLAIVYNAGDRIEKVTDSVGRQSLFTYDVANEHLASVRNFDGAVVFYDYVTNSTAQRNHAIASVTYPGNLHTHFTYDVRGRLLSTYADGNAGQVSFAYDSAGGVDVTNALDHTTKFFLDHRGLMAKVEDPQGDATHFAYDASFELRSSTDAAGRSYAYDYGPRGNLTRVVDPLGNPTHFEYAGPFDRMTRLTDANGTVTDYAYYPDGNLKSTTYDDGSRESWTYDDFGNPVSWTNRRGQTVSYAFNANGRLDSKQLPGDPLTSYLYDSRGDLKSAANKAGAVTMDYFPPGHPHADKLQRITYPGGQWLEYTYNAAGQRATMVDQLSHRLEYHYDPAGRLWYITDESSAEVVRYGYDPAGRPQRKTLGNDVYTTYEYDEAGQVEILHNRTPDNSTLSRFEYTYDSRGRRTSMTTSFGAGDPRAAGTWTYTYDDVGQLTAWSSPDGTSVEYVYDAVGNRVTETRNGATTAYTANGLNQYTEVGNVTYTYDLDGNLIRETTPAAVTNYTFDAENRMVGFADASNAWLSTYDALGRRWQLNANGNVYNYVTDLIGNGNLVGEYNAATGAVLKRYDHGFGLLDSWTTAAAKSWYTFDAIGSTSEWGTVSPAYRYTTEPFGRSVTHMPPGAPVADPPQAQRFQFVGEFGVQYEIAGLRIHDMRARQFIRQIGRFGAADPIGLAGGDTNLYRYVKNDGVSDIDPAGLAGSKPVRLRQRRIPPPPRNDHPIQPSEMWDVFLELIVHGQEPYGDPRNRPMVFDVGDSLNGWGDEDWGKPAPSPGDPLPKRPTPEVPERNPSVPPSEFPDWPGNGGNFPGGYDPNPNWPGPPPTQPGGAGTSGTSTAVDPNEKAGPAGFGPEHWVPASGVLPYRIDFENDATATAPAQDVAISDQLNMDFDWDSFELTEIGFGDVLIVVPPGSASYQGAVDFTHNGETFQVLIRAGIRRDTGRVFARFLSVNPVTGLPPSVLAGFLPPENGTGRGMGHVSYTIMAKAALATGTPIRNVASITFDRGEVIFTNQVDPHDPTKGTDPAREALVTIDAGPPSSSITALAAQSPAAFLLSWAGADDDGGQTAGSGVATYDVYVSDNGAPPVLFRDDTPETGATFVGRIGHTYQFYSVATDNVGHAEAAPPAGTFDAQTAVTSAGVAGRRVFYNNSFFDTPTAQNPGFGDDSAIAPDRQALLPGGTATAANYTNYSRGINGVMVDVAGPPSATLAASDFIFRIGNDNNPAAWPAAPAPTVTVRPGAGASGSDRVTFTWPDNAIRRTWLQVTVKAGARTGLASPDVFYFGNLPGDTFNSADGSANFLVNSLDVQRTRINQFQPAPVTSVFDHDKSGNITNSIDLQLSRINQFSSINRISIPSAAALR